MRAPPRALPSRELGRHRVSAGNRGRCDSDRRAYFVGRRLFRRVDLGPAVPVRSDADQAFEILVQRRGSMYEPRVVDTFMRVHDQIVAGVSDAPTPRRDVMQQIGKSVVPVQSVAQPSVSTSAAFSMTSSRLSAWRAWRPAPVRKTPPLLSAPLIAGDSLVGTITLYGNRRRRSLKITRGWCKSLRSMSRRRSVPYDGAIPALSRRAVAKTQSPATSELRLVSTR